MYSLLDWITKKSEKRVFGNENNIHPQYIHSIYNKLTNEHTISILSFANLENDILKFDILRNTYKWIYRIDSNVDYYINKDINDKDDAIDVKFAFASGRFRQVGNVRFSQIESQSNSYDVTFWKSQNGSASRAGSVSLRDISSISLKKMSIRSYIYTVLLQQHCLFRFIRIFTAKWKQDILDSFESKKKF